MTRKHGQPLLMRRLDSLQQDAAGALRGIRRGIEKESLRVTQQGRLAQTPHPVQLGSALKHPQITTDFSEALLEFITPACDSIAETLAWLDDIHAYAYSVLSAQQEEIWVASMPCVLPDDDAIPLAQYGTTHTARMKTTYREGLGWRYGRRMQTIAGIHYNLSFPDALWQHLQALDGDKQTLQDYKTSGYFALIRNFRRHLWLLLYLFGASPAVCASFVQGRAHQLQAFDARNSSLFLPQATSLRMGDLGYQSNAQSAMMVCYNSLSTYINTLKQGLTTPYPPYEQIGVRDASGHYRQLSTNLLQIENEFYSTIRPKRVARSGETPIRALHERGVEYIEVRCLDLDPYCPTGLDRHTAHFVEAFLLWCLLSDSAPMEETEYHRHARNQRKVVEEGRSAGLQLENGDGVLSLFVWADAIMDEIATCAALLDSANPDSTGAYAQALQVQRQKLADSDSTSSARVLADMRAKKLSFFELACAQSQQHVQYYRAHRLSAERQRAFRHMAESSLAMQHELEQQGSPLTFEQYLQQYYAQYDLIN